MVHIFEKIFYSYPLDKNEQNYNAALKEILSSADFEIILLKHF